MSSQYNSFRNRRYIRSRFLDGRFLLSQEASDLELEVLEYARRVVQNSLGDIAIGDAWKTAIVPLSLGITNSQKKLIVRPGIAYYNGLLFEMTAGTDHKVSADASQPVTVGTPNDPGGKILDFTSRPTGYYKILTKAMEEKVTADQDAFLKGAAVPENTEEKRRLIYSLSAVPCDSNGNIAGKDPLNFTRTDDITSGQQSQFFTNNDKFQIDRTPNSITPTSDTLGTSVVVTFSNTDGAGTIFPTGTLMNQVFAGGLFIDPDGAVYFINAVQVTTGPDQVSFFLDQELAVPAGSGLQPNPNLGTAGLKYTLIPADVVIADSSSGLPVGTRNYAIAEVYWNGTDFSMSPFGFSSSGGSVQYNIRDLRSTGTAEAIASISARILWQLTGGGNVKWDLSNQKASWDANIIVKVPNNLSLEYVIAPGDTFSLFASNFAENEVLYFVVPNNTSGSVSVLPQKNARGTGDLAAFDPSLIYILAYRVGNRIHWNSDCLVLGDGETGSFGQGFFNQYLKLVRGGNWLWTLGTNTLSWDAIANVQLDGLAENRNTIPIGNVVLPSDGSVAYTTVNRGAGALANLTLSVANIASVPVNENTFIVARRIGNTVLVGAQSMLLIDLESKTLDAGLSNQNKTLIGGAVNPITEATSDPQWATRGSPQRTISASPSNTNDILDQIVSMDVELDKFFGQFRLKAQSSPNQHVTVTSSDVTMLTGETRSQTIANLLTQPATYDINFQTGVITPNGSNFTPVIPAAGMFRWASIGLLPFSTTADLRINLQVLVIFGSADGASPSAAPKAPFSSAAFNLGEVVLTSADGVNISAIAQTALVQLGIGSGAGSGSGSGSGVGDDLDSLTYRASFRDTLTDLPSSSVNAIDYSAGKTNPNNFSIVNHYIRLAYDASELIAGGTTATHILLNNPATYTVAVGDIIIIQREARRIITVNSQSDFVVEGTGFTFTPTLGQQVTVSQAVYTQDLNNYTGTGQPISTSFPDTINDLLVQYGDSITLNDSVPDWNSPARVAYDVSTNGPTNYTEVFTRPVGFQNSELISVVANPGTNLFLRFFSNFTTGNGFVNLLSYRAFFHREPVADFLPQLSQASGRTDGNGALINCTVDNSGSFTIIGGLPDYSVGVHPGTIGGQLEVYVNGQKIPRFLDATSTPAAWYEEIDGNSIRLDSSYKFLPYEFEVLKRVGTVDVTDDNVTDISSIKEVFEDQFQNVLDQDDALLAPFNGTPVVGQFRSDIQNRAPIPDLTQDLLARMGINRICTQQIIPLPNEVGPAGEQVFGVVNDKFGQLRFVGSWAFSVDSTGNRITSAIVNDYIEIVFYGTGLNFLTSANGALDVRYTLDGAPESGNIFPNMSGIITGRNYSANIIIPVVKGLTLGVHTIKLRNNTTGTTSFFGFEILNESSQITVPPGSAFANSKKISHALLESLPYSSSFESGVLGTKGGRVLVYLKPNGLVGKALTPTNASQLNLTSADHTNEEVIRSYHYREFGSGRSDDFSILANSNTNAAFTIEDNSNALEGSQVLSDHPTGTDAVRFGPSGSFLTFNFVGTGLDILRVDDGTGTETYEVFVDGTSVGNLPTTGIIASRTDKIVSGLPYGSHTVKIVRNTTASFARGVIKFNVYAPKKPALPNGAIELADYSILANFIANSTASLINLSTGILRKVSGREFVYVGGWTISNPDFTDKVAAASAFTSTSGDYFQYTFFGTGFDLRYLAKNDRSSDMTVSLNGTTLTSANFGTAVFTNYGGTTSFNSGTGSLNQNTASNTPGAGFTVSGLPLALYTLKIQNNQNSVMTVDTLDIIAPIHAYKFNENMSAQDTLNIGSQSLRDERKLSVHGDLSENKHICQCFGITGESTSDTDPQQDGELTTTIRMRKDGMAQVSYAIVNDDNVSTDVVSFQIYVDGTPVGQLRFNQQNTAGANTTTCDLIAIPLSKGFHKIGIYWHVNGGTGAVSSLRGLTVREL